MLSVDAFRIDLWSGLANTDDSFDTDDNRDNNVSAGQLTSPTYVITHSQRQQVRTKLRLLLICFAVFSPLNVLIMHDK